MVRNKKDYITQPGVVQGYGRKEKKKKKKKKLSMFSPEILIINQKGEASSYNKKKKKRRGNRIQEASREKLSSHLLLHIHLPQIRHDPIQPRRRQLPRPFFLQQPPHFPDQKSRIIF